MHALLLEQVLEVRSRALPPDHPQLQATRLNLGQTIKDLGDLKGARELEEQVLEVAVILHAQGDLAGARALSERVLETLLRTLPADHPQIQQARLHLAVSTKKQGDL